jgi:hypothetical protein
MGLMIRRCKFHGPKKSNSSLNMHSLTPKSKVTTEELQVLIAMEMLLHEQAPRQVKPLLKNGE